MNKPASSTEEQGLRASERVATCVREREERVTTHSNRCASALSSEAHTTPAALALFRSSLSTRPYCVRIAFSLFVVRLGCVGGVFNALVGGRDARPLAGLSLSV